MNIFIFKYKKVRFYKDCRKLLDHVRKLENPDEDKKDTIEGHGEEEDEDYILLDLTAEDSLERQGSQASPPSLVENPDAIGSAKAQEEKGNYQNIEKTDQVRLGVSQLCRYGLPVSFLLSSGQATWRGACEE